MVNQRYPESAGKTKTEKMITIFTPTYNRAEFLAPLYDSIKNQSSKDFEWVIVDDGSTDNTHSTVAEIINSHDGSFPIRYFKKPNGGKHTAINMGVNVAEGELFFILDSDDELPNNSLEIVYEEWGKVKNNPLIAGVAGLDINKTNNRIIGSGLPLREIDCNAMDIRFRYKVKGDLKEVFRTSVLKDFPFPEIDGERFCPEQLVWFQIAQKYKLHYFNKAIYCAEYQENGLSSQITRARMNSPIASMMTYAELNGYDVPLKEKAKAAINFWRFRLCSKGNSNGQRIGAVWNVLAPIGIIMHLRDKWLH